MAPKSPAADKICAVHLTVVDEEPMAGLPLAEALRRLLKVIDHPDTSRLIISQMLETSSKPCM
jgi:hypothetical protein